MPERSLIAVANEQVSILAVCRMVGVDLPEDAGMARSRKTFCPFGEVYHSDAGLEPAMRVYPDSNSAWCFRCATYFTPVKMAAQAWDQDWRTAAVVLLDRIGYRPASLAEQWSAVCVPVVAPDTTLLGEALKVFCARHDPQWSVHQFEPEIAGHLSRCLALLDRVGDDEAAQAWLRGTKQAMARLLADRMTWSRA